MILGAAGLSPASQPCPARRATHRAFEGLVVGGEREDDHGTQVGDHIDVEGHGPELAPLVPQQLVDGLHGQHFMAVLQVGAGTESPRLALPTLSGTSLSAVPKGVAQLAGFRASAFQAPPNSASVYLPSKGRTRAGNPQLPFLLWQ